MKRQKRISLTLSIIFIVVAISASGIPGAQGKSNTITNSTSADNAALSAPASASGATYYVRTDGGTAAQCTGLVNAAYSGSGVGQSCAWNHPFQALSPDGTKRIAGGDTLIIGAGDYKMGYDESMSYDCHMPPIPSGLDPTHPTRLLGAGWDSGCAAPPELWGSGRPWFMVNLTDSNNFEIRCLEITDHSSCIEAHMADIGSLYTCNQDTPPYGDWASIGLYAEDSANVT
jgi:hypothetical protein